TVRSSGSASTKLGACLSSMVMICVCVVLLPAQSVAVHMRSRVVAHPSEVIFSSKVTVALASQLSIAVSNAASGTSPQATVISSGSASTKLGACLSSTVMICVCVVLLPTQSQAVHMRSGLVSHPSEVIFSSKVTVALASQLSIAVSTVASGTSPQATVRSSGSASTKLGACLRSE